MSESMNFKEKTYQLIYEEFSTVLDRIEEVKNGLPDATRAAAETITDGFSTAVTEAEQKLKLLKNEIDEAYCSFKDVNEDMFMEVENHFNKCEQRLYSPISTYVEILSNAEKLIEMMFEEIDAYSRKVNEQIGASARAEASYAVIAAGKAGVQAEVMPLLTEARCQLDHALEQLVNAVNESQISFNNSAKNLDETAQAARKALADRLGQFISGSRVKIALAAASVILVSGIVLGSAVATFSMHQFMRYQQHPDLAELQGNADSIDLQEAESLQFE
ncbi:hypothetical protein [Spirochaeta dissipatitropha]